ncbi:hypothetical protein D3C79_962440 [compost metagenome]
MKRIELFDQRDTFNSRHSAALFRNQATDTEMLVVVRDCQGERRMTQIDIYVEVVAIQPGAQLDQ